MTSAGYGVAVAAGREVALAMTAAWFTVAGVDVPGTSAAGFDLVISPPAKITTKARMACITWIGIFFMEKNGTVDLSAFFPRGPGENIECRGNQFGNVCLTYRYSFLEIFKGFEKPTAQSAGPVRPI